jgi:hypothetical protein
MMNILAESAWFVPLLWIVLYTSDYFLTIACARLYKAQDKIVFEGSYEINPRLQSDVNALRLLSPRFLLFLFISTALLAFMRILSTSESGSAGFYELVVGVMILAEITVHIRHLRNWYIFKRAIGYLKGRIEYPRGIMLRISAFEFVVFGIVYVAFFALARQRFFLGGALVCGALSMNHLLLARKHERSSPKNV